MRFSLKFPILIFIFGAIVFSFCRTRGSDEDQGSPPLTPKPNPTGSSPGGAIESVNYLSGSDPRILGTWTAKPFTFKTLTLKFEADKLTFGVRCTDSGKVMEASESTDKFEVAKKSLKILETLEPVRSDDKSRCDGKMGGNFTFRIETDNEFVLIATPGGETRFNRSK